MHSRHMPVAHMLPWFVLLWDKAGSSSAGCEVSHSFSEVWGKGCKQPWGIVFVHLAVPDRLKVHRIQMLYDLLQVFKAP